MNTPVVYRGSCPRCGGAAVYRAELHRLVGAWEVPGCWWVGLVEFRSVLEDGDETVVDGVGWLVRDAGGDFVYWDAVYAYEDCF